MAITEEKLGEVLGIYPEKVLVNRRRHIVLKEPDTETAQQIEANTRTLPGIITNRGCAFAGCKGVVVGPIKDMVHIFHGPVCCAFYTWGTRRNKAKAGDDGKNYVNYCLTTDMQESDVVFGGEKSLPNSLMRRLRFFIRTQSPLRQPVRLV
ncbi:MAG: hypothetical protein ALMCE001_07150 [Methanocorpusculum sp. MCE]|nr:MAG: hypothetical protein ALMCE001_07150 [Methanocorpusculum sp. MCE]